MSRIGFYGDVMYVPPWTIFSGLGALDRRDVCNLIAIFETTTLLSMSMDRASDILVRLQKGGQSSDVTAFASRLKDAADNLFVSKVDTPALRIRLWGRISEALDMDATLPLSSQKANTVGAAICLKTAAILDMPAVSEVEPTPETGIQKARQALASVFGRPHQDFSCLVAERARLIATTVAAAAQSGELSEHEQYEFNERIRDHIQNIPPELRDDAMRNALASGDKAALALIATGTAAFSISVGVNLAGFSAYILAAQASAFIPFMSGPAIVSTLFMLANPLFSIPVVLGAGYFANRYVNSGQAAKLAASVCVQLALRGLSADRDGLAVILNDFRNASQTDLNPLPLNIRTSMLSRIKRVSLLSGSGLPKSVGKLRSSSLLSDRQSNLLDEILSKSRGDVVEMGLTAGLSTGDILYNAVSIDPMVLAAADFSRAQDISDIFKFGAFASHISSMSETAAAGAENNLRGYVSEQLVAARLVEIGHVVNFPETSNNAGFDLLVDGIPFQVKCLRSLEGLREHFLKYPDMPVYANAELSDAVIASGASWSKLVFYVDGFDREIANMIMNASLEAGEALGDLNVPYFAAAVSTVRNLHRVWSGDIPLSDLPISVVMDASVKGSLSAVGALSGKTLGLLAFGPAGALVLGSVGGIGALTGASWTKGQVTRLLSSEWLSELDASTERFRIAVLMAIRAKVGMLQDKKASVPKSKSEIDDWIQSRFTDDIVSLGEVICDLEELIPTLDQPEKARACLSAMDAAKVHPLAVEAELTEILKLLGAEPSKSQATGKFVLQAWSTAQARLPFKS